MTSFRDICENLPTMILRYFKKMGIVFILVAVSLMLMGGSVLATHECCGHPSNPDRTADSGTETSSSDSSCFCICCQADIVVTPSPVISNLVDPWRSVGNIAVSAASHIETDIFRPPLA